jgi:hypothetical protein
VRHETDEPQRCDAHSTARPCESQAALTVCERNLRPFRMANADRIRPAACRSGIADAPEIADARE